MSNNKQTAVDYLDEAIDKYLAYCVEGSHKGEPFKLEKLYAAVQQAKAMHQQEMIEFAQWMYDYKGDINKVEELFEQFKKK